MRPIRSSGSARAARSSRGTLKTRSGCRPAPADRPPAGLVVVVKRDFDGYFAEIARALTDASRFHKSLVRLALVTDADRRGEARLSGFDGSSVRLFATAERKAALDWAAARQ